MEDMDEFKPELMPEIDSVGISLSNLDELCCACLKNCKAKGINVHQISSNVKRHIFCYKKSQKLSYPNLLCPSCYKVIKSFEELCSIASHNQILLKNYIKSSKCVKNLPDEKQKHPPEIASVVNNVARTSSPFEETKEEAEKEFRFEEILIKTETESEELTLEVNSMKDDALLDDHFAKSEEKNNLKDHLYKCTHCNRRYSFAKNLSKHLTEVHKLKDSHSPIPCPYEKCKQTFNQREVAAQHYRLKHELVVMNKPKPKGSHIIMCEECGRMFANTQKLKEHSYKHLPVDVRPFHCEVCNKYFVTKNSFKEHQLRHVGVKPHECKYCGIRKTTARELRVHLNCHTKEKQFHCTQCSRIFNRLSNLKIHDRVVHKRIRKFNCRFCDQSFGKPDTLKHHEMRHTGEKPHKCGTCGRKFIQPAALKAHIKTHDKVRKKSRREVNRPKEAEEDS